MDTEARQEAKRRLAALIERVMADNKIDPAEKVELNALYRQAILTVSDVEEVLARYVRAVQAEVLSDGRVTEDDRRRCRAILWELKIPLSLLPQAFKAIAGV